MIVAEINDAHYSISSDYFLIVVPTAVASSAEFTRMNRDEIRTQGWPWVLSSAVDATHKRFTIPAAALSAEGALSVWVVSPEAPASLQGCSVAQLQGSTTGSCSTNRLWLRNPRAVAPLWKGSSVCPLLTDDVPPQDYTELPNIDMGSHPEMFKISLHFNASGLPKPANQISDATSVTILDLPGILNLSCTRPYLLLSVEGREFGWVGHSDGDHTHT